MTGAEILRRYTKGEREADLSWANLREADLRGADVAQISASRYTVTVTPTHIHCGCERVAREDYDHSLVAELCEKHGEDEDTAADLCRVIDAALALAGEGE